MKPEQAAAAEVDNVAPAAEVRPEPGIMAALGRLEPLALINQDGMGRMFKRGLRSIQRAVERGELPPPIRMFGQQVWTAESVWTHIRQRLEKQAKGSTRVYDRH